MRGLALCAVLLGSCVLRDVDLTGLPCPCAGADYTCDAASNTCIKLVSGPFTLAVTPAAVTLPQGRTTVVSVDLTTSVAQAVSVSVNDLPGGIAATPGSLLLTMAKPHGELTLTSDASTVIGTDTAHVTGKGPTGNTVTQAFAITVTGGPGTVDTAFGSGGSVAVTDVASPGLTGMLLDAQDRIIVETESSRDYVLTRFSPDGVLDTSFGTAGVTTMSSPDAQTSLSLGGAAAQPDGKLLIGGSLFSSAGMTARLWRYTSDGQLDATFGVGGTLAVDAAFGATISEMRSVVALADGRILVAVDAGTSYQTTHPSLARYLADGTLDTTFGSAGVLVTSLSTDQAATNALIVTTDQQIVLGGIIYDAMSHGFVARFSSDGVVDSTFADGGIALGEDGTEITSVVQSRSGALLATGGDYTTTYMALTGGYVSRYLASGALDPTFGVAGTSTIVSTQPPSQGVGTVLEKADGSLMIVESQFLAQLDATGAPDTKFGEVLVPPPYQFNSVAAQSTGRIVVLESDFTYGQQLMRYWP